MDDEIVTTLNNLIDAVNNLNDSVDALTHRTIQDPNWWAVGLTLVSIIVTGVFSFILWKTNKEIGKRQNELQEQQIDIQKRQHILDCKRTYKPLLEDLNKLHEFACFFINSIYLLVYDSARGQLYEQHLNEINNEIAELITIVRKDEIQIKLNIKDWEDDFGAMIFLLKIADEITKNINSLLSNNLLNHKNINVNFDLVYDRFADDSGRIDNIFQILDTAIVAQQSKNLAIETRNLMQKYIELHKEIFHTKDSICKRVEKLCGINNDSE